MDPAALCGRTLFDEPVDLLDASMTVPPEGGHDAHREIAGVVQRAVGAKEVGPHPCVLPAGDAERVQVPLCDEQRIAPLGVGRRGHDAFPERICRAFVQSARGLA